LGDKATNPGKKLLNALAEAKKCVENMKSNTLNVREKTFDDFLRKISPWM
jgi:hypothetical protein